MSTKHAFQLQRDKGLPDQLIPFVRLCYCQEESELNSINLQETGELTESDELILMQLVQYLQNRLARYSAHGWWGQPHGGHAISAST